MFPTSVREFPFTERIPRRCNGPPTRKGPVTGLPNSLRTRLGSYCNVSASHVSFVGWSQAGRQYAYAYQNNSSRRSTTARASRRLRSARGRLRTRPTLFASLARRVRRAGALVSRAVGRPVSVFRVSDGPRRQGVGEVERRTDGESGSWSRARLGS